MTRARTPRRAVARSREHLAERVSVSDVCEKRKIQPSLFYDRQKQRFESGAAPRAVA